MRIIKPGNDRVAFEGKWTCEHCPCEWEYDETDDRPAQLVRIVNTTVNTNVYSLPCPACDSMAHRPLPKRTDAAE